MPLGAHLLWILHVSEGNGMGSHIFHFQSLSQHWTGKMFDDFCNEF